MTVKSEEGVFESAFHKRYVGGEGEVVMGEVRGENDSQRVTVDVAAEISRYRQYVGVSTEMMSDDEVMASLGIIKGVI